MALVKNAHPPASPDHARGQGREYADLLVQLTDADSTVRRWAARDLLQHAQATPALVARLPVEADRSVREVILTTLTRLGDAAAVAGLVSCLRSEDAQPRNEAIEAMQSLPDEVAPIMGGLLKDDDADVRIMAVNILQSLQHPKVEQWLIDVIDHDDQVNVCGTAVDLLGEVGSLAARGALERLRLRFAGEPYIVFATDLALQRIVNS